MIGGPHAVSEIVERNMVPIGTLSTPDTCENWTGTAVVSKGVKGPKDVWNGLNAPTIASPARSAGITNHTRRNVTP